MRPHTFISDQDLADFLEELAPFIESRGTNGSELMKAFEVLRSSWKSDDGYQRGAVNAAYMAWLGTPDQQKRFILNGWRPVPVPVLRERIQEQIDGVNGVSSVATFVTSDDGVMFVYPDLVFNGGMIGATQLHFTRGTTREEAIAFLELALATVNAKWDDVIAMDSDDQLTFDVVRDGQPLPA